MFKVFSTIISKISEQISIDFVFNKFSIPKPGHEICKIFYQCRIDFSFKYCIIARGEKEKFPKSSISYTEFFFVSPLDKTTEKLQLSWTLIY